MKRLRSEVPFVDSILHPTDFSAESETAFAHALALALRQQASLTILNAGASGRGKRWTEFPSVRGTLARWGLVDEGTARGSVFRQLDLHVKKVRLKKRRPLHAVLDYVDEHPADLIVLATEGREGLPRWIRPSLAETIARRSETMTLFVSGPASGFVCADDGSLTLRRIIVPVDHHPHPHAAVVCAARAAAMSPSTPVEIVVLHVGTSTAPPELSLQDSPFCAWSTVTKDGDVVEEVIRTAGECSADLIVMATQGHDGILDALRGSVTEQVVRKAPCPVLAVPAHQMLL